MNDLYPEFVNSYQGHLEDGSSILGSFSAFSIHNLNVCIHDRIKLSLTDYKLTIFTFWSQLICIHINGSSSDCLLSNWGNDKLPLHR